MRVSTATNRQADNNPSLQRNAPSESTTNGGSGADLDAKHSTRPDNAPRLPEVSPEIIRSWLEFRMRYSEETELRPRSTGAPLVMPPAREE